MDSSQASAIVKEPSPGVLYLVGTPIGHRGDLSPRAQQLLAAVDRVACEDTRHSGLLLHGLGIQQKLISFHQHNQQQRIPELLQALADGEALALISDAGLPGISDPGEELVAAARAAGHAVICIPGPCAATTALVSSGLPSGRFCFEGFLPAKGRERQQRLAAIAQEERTSVLYEAPHRLLQLLKELIEQCGAERPVQVARELTKRHEEQVGPTLAAALEHFSVANPKASAPWCSAALPPANQKPGMTMPCAPNCKSCRPVASAPPMPPGNWPAAAATPGASSMRCCTARQTEAIANR